MGEKCLTVAQKLLNTSSKPTDIKQDTETTSLYP